MKHITILNGKLKYSKRLLKDGVFIDLLSGFFPKVMKRGVCRNRGLDCRLCELKEKCSYAYIFEPVLSGEKSLVVSLPDIKIPFAFKWNFGDRETDFSLCLFGRCINFTSDILQTISEIGDMGLGRERFRYEVSDLSSADLSLDSTSSIDLKHIDIENLSSYDIAEVKALSQNMSSLNLKINLLSDFDLFRSNRQSKGDRVFQTFYRRIRDRLRALYEIYLNEDLPMEIKGLSEKSEDIIERQTGENVFEFKGSIAAFRFAFLLGSYFNIGRRCAFGKGSYRIIL